VLVVLLILVTVVALITVMIGAVVVWLSLVVSVL
jgi:hypothetical protein